MQDQKACKQFYEYCVTRCMAESVRFWIATEAFQNSAAAHVLGFASSRSLVEHANFIWNQYMSGDAPDQVCVPDAVQDALINTIATLGHERTMFREARRYIMKDLDVCFHEYVSQQITWDQQMRVKQIGHLNHPHCVAANVMANGDLICAQRR